MFGLPCRLWVVVMCVIWNRQNSPRVTDIVCQEGNGFQEQGLATRGRECSSNSGRGRTM